MGQQTEPAEPFSLTWLVENCRDRPGMMGLGPGYDELVTLLYGFFLGRNWDLNRSFLEWLAEHHGFDRAVGWNSQIRWETVPERPSWEWHEATPEQEARAKARLFELLLEWINDTESGTQPGHRRAVKFPCPCCGHLVFAEPPGSEEICPVCFWEDDALRLRWPTRAGGANNLSLVESQRNVFEHGAVEARFASSVRQPTPYEPIDAGWRPIGDGDDLEVWGEDPAPWPDDLTVLYYWRDTYRPGSARR